MRLKPERSGSTAPLRDRILEAATELFVRNGFDGVSMRQIARRARCSPGMLYHFFSNKELLLARVVENTFAKLDQRLARCACGDGDPLRRLEQTLRAYADFGFDHPHEYGFLFTHGHDRLAPDVLSVFETRGLGCYQRILVLCQEAIAAGLLRERPGGAVETAQALWAAVHGLVHLLHAADGFPFAPRKRLIRHQLQILIAGVREV